MRPHPSPDAADADAAPRALVAVANPPNPWATSDVEYLEAAPAQDLVVYHDLSRSIVSQNDSPDLGFRFTVNPYRGCFHGCAYCYARPTHERLSFGAGTDFDRRIVVKPDAASLLRAFFAGKKWDGSVLVFSGVTDCYQPVEASYRLTRACLEVCLHEGAPVHVVTKSPLVERDLDVLAALAAGPGAGLSVSIPLFDAHAARALEPWVTTPLRRLRTIERAAKAGVPVTLNVAPFVPGLSEKGLGELLARAKEAGATRAMRSVLRLPGPVAQVFAERLEAALPGQAGKVLSRVRELRGGRLNDPRFGTRHTGEGPYAEATQRLFEAACTRVGLAVDGEREPGSFTGGVEPKPRVQEPPGPRQLPLFDEPPPPRRAPKRR